MPHAPILIPEIAKDRNHAVAASQSSMERVGKEVATVDPDIVIVLSPHAPRRTNAFGIYRHPNLKGALIQFGWYRPFFEFSNDRLTINAIIEAGRQHNLRFFDIADEALDHGATVPLYFLHKTGWQGKVVVLGLGPQDDRMLMSLGACIRSTMEAKRTRFVLIASGDMSHRVTRNAPCGYHPDAANWDKQLIRLVQSADIEGIRNMNQDKRTQAAEDSVDSLKVTLGAINETAFHPTIYSYEAPFGVGYGTARLTQDTSMAATQNVLIKQQPQTQQLPLLARIAVMKHLHLDSNNEPLFDASMRNWKAGVFVTIRTKSGDLRGCIGTIEPQHPDILEETRRNAVASAFQDHRFHAIVANELPNLCFEVSILHPPEPVTNLDALDPQSDGLIIHTKDGRRGLMLPDIPQLNTVEKQIEAICRKVNIPRDTPMDFQTFKVEKIKEDPD